MLADKEDIGDVVGIIEKNALDMEADSTLWNRIESLNSLQVFQIEALELVLQDLEMLLQVLIKKINEMTI
jgi:predicted DNA binding CopG/RHH family protein